MTDVSRRSVIGLGAAGIAVGALGVPVPSAVAAPGVVAQAADPTYTTSAGLYRRSRFTALRGRWFGLSGGGHRITVRLSAVGDLPTETVGSEEDFRLTFTCGSAGPPQGTYTLRRTGFTTTSLFVVPDEQRRTYTAVINTAR